MEGVLWYLLASSRGGPTRVRILRALEDRPRNANQLATHLEYDYTTIRHHLDVFLENNVVRRTDDDYAAVYLLSDQVRANWDIVEEILDTVDTESDREPDRETGSAGDDAGDSEDGGGNGNGDGNEHGGATPEGDP